MWIVEHVVTDYVMSNIDGTRCRSVKEGLVKGRGIRNRRICKGVNVARVSTGRHWRPACPNTPVHSPGHTTRLLWPGTDALTTVLISTQKPFTILEKCASSRSLACAANSPIRWVVILVINQIKTDKGAERLRLSVIWQTAIYLILLFSFRQIHT